MVPDEQRDEMLDPVIPLFLRGSEIAYRTGLLNATVVQACFAISQAAFRTSRF